VGVWGRGPPYQAVGLHSTMPPFAGDVMVIPPIAFAPCHAIRLSHEEETNHSRRP
jgi:hypothetical protein